MLLVFGSRIWSSSFTMGIWLDAFSGYRVLAHGACRGADAMAGEIGRSTGWDVRSYPVDHALDGPWPGAGPRRNARMLALTRPEFAIGFVVPQADGSLSRGSSDMARRLALASVPFLIVTPDARPRRAP